VLTMNSVKILHAVRSAITATAELLVGALPTLNSWWMLSLVPPAPGYAFFADEMMFSHWLMMSVRVSNLAMLHRYNDRRLLRKD